MATVTVKESKDYPNWFIVILPSKGSGYMKNPNPMEGMKEYLFPNKDAAKQAANEAGFAVSE